MPKKLATLLITAVFPLLLLSLTIHAAGTATQQTSDTILIDAVYFDTYEKGEPEEAVRLYNAGDVSVDLSGWQLADDWEDGASVSLPSGHSIAPGEGVWITKNGPLFARQFGFAADIVVSGWPGYSNNGDEVVLLNDVGQVVDTVVYKGGNAKTMDATQWSGVTVVPYTPINTLGADGQILYRRRDQGNGRPAPDTNTSADWAQGMDDVVNGRKVRYPGWDLDEFFFTKRVTETAVLTVAIAPDNAYETVLAAIDGAQHTLQIESHTLESTAIGEALAAAATRGVSVTVLLEGGPPGGVSDQESYLCQQLEAANGRCWFMKSNGDRSIFDRYSYLHAKFIIIDGETVIISSENLSPNSMPHDDKSDGTWGRRGVMLMTDAPGVVAHVQSIFNHDFDPAHHVDITNTSAIDPPPFGYIPSTETGGVTYTVRFPAPSSFTGSFSFELIQSPENSLRDQDGLLGLLAQAGTDDTVLAQQLYERPYWGSNGSDPTADPNVRLEAYIAAARRGARVRILLDSYFDDGDASNSNKATCQYVEEIAKDERLDLKCALGNPAGLGIHNKMVLAQINGRGYIHVGSINGSEQSHKGNRELALQVQADGAYELLAEMFFADWPHRVYLPNVCNDYIGPANHVLISEVLYDSPGQDNAEFIELANPTGSPIDLSDFSVGDAVNPSDFEDVRRFPTGTTIQPLSTLVVATSSSHFEAEYGRKPDFEILNTDAHVPGLIDHPDWGDPATFLQLGNSGDEVILRNSTGQVVDVIAYGAGSYPGMTNCPLVSTFNSSLERHPYWRDTDDCAADFREWPFPTPGTLP